MAQESISDSGGGGFEMGIQHSMNWTSLLSNNEPTTLGNRIVETRSVLPRTTFDLGILTQTSKGFIYVVSTNSTTGNATKEVNTNEEYLERIAHSKLDNPTLIGFNIKDKPSFLNACKYANGAIIGSAFVKMLNESEDIESDIKKFIEKIKG